MKIKLDENLPENLQAALAEQGHDVDTVRAEGLRGADDDTIWSAAQESGRFLITQDMDFSDLRRFVFGAHRGVMVVRLTQSGLRSLVRRITNVFETEDVDSWSGCFVIATDNKVRVRRSHQTR